MTCLWVNKPTFINEMDIFTLTTGYQKMEEAIIYGVHKQSNSLPSPWRRGSICLHCALSLFFLGYIAYKAQGAQTRDKVSELSWWHNAQRCVSFDVAPPSTQGALGYICIIAIYSS